MKFKLAANLLAFMLVAFSLSFCSEGNNTKKSHSKSDKSDNGQEQLDSKVMESLNENEKKIVRSVFKWKKENKKVGLYFGSHINGEHGFEVPNLDNVLGEKIHWITMNMNEDHANIENHLVSEFIKEKVVFEALEGQFDIISDDRTCGCSRIHSIENLDVLKMVMAPDGVFLSNYYPSNGIALMVVDESNISTLSYHGYYFKLKNFEFTEEKIREVYENLLQEAKTNPADWGFMGPVPIDISVVFYDADGKIQKDYSSRYLNSNLAFEFAEKRMQQLFRSVEVREITVPDYKNNPVSQKVFVLKK